MSLPCYDNSMDIAANWLTIVGGVLGIVGIISFILAYFKSNLSKETIELHEKNRQALEDRVKILEESDKGKTKQIGELEGQIRTLKTLPLEKLADSYATMAETLRGMGETQNKLLELMSVQQQHNS